MSVLLLTIAYTMLTLTFYVCVYVHEVRVKRYKAFGSFFAKFSSCHYILIFGPFGSFEQLYFIIKNVFLEL